MDYFQIDKWFQWLYVSNVPALYYLHVGEKDIKSSKKSSSALMSVILSALQKKNALGKIGLKLVTLFSFLWTEKRNVCPAFLKTIIKVMCGSS